MSAVERKLYFLSKRLTPFRVGIALLLAASVLATTIAHACASQLQAAANPVAHAAGPHHHSMPPPNPKRDGCAFGCDQLGSWAAPTSTWNITTTISQTTVSLAINIELLAPETMPLRAVISAQQLFVRLKQPLFIINSAFRI